jgi:hypothetical protein
MRLVVGIVGAGQTGLSTNAPLSAGEDAYALAT